MHADMSLVCVSCRRHCSPGVQPGMTCFCEVACFRSLDVSFSRSVLGEQTMYAQGFVHNLDEFFLHILIQGLQGFVLNPILQQAIAAIQGLHGFVLNPILQQTMRAVMWLVCV